MISKIHIYTLLFLTSTHLFSQDCLEYAEINGEECGACVPDGWDPFSGTTPDIVPTDGSYPFGGCNLNDISSDSPGGGNVVLLAGAPPSYQEGMTTTVSGLDPNIEYGFGLWWEQITADGCGDWAEGNLIIEVDGETYTFDDAESWEFIEFCFFPSGESVDITLMIEIGIEQTILLVDSPDCADVTACCELQILADEMHVVCPGNEQLFFADYFNETGSVDVEWTSDPEDGIDFLDDPTSITPIFLMPVEYDFEGEEYLFTLTVQDEDCQRTSELTLIVEPNIIPEFDIYLCELDEDPEFPTTSMDGFSGFWDGNFDLLYLGGTTQEFLFTLNPGQENCLESWTYPIYIEPEIELNFTYQSVFCALDDTRYTLPFESDENAQGEWDTEKFNPYDLGPGTYQFTFFPEENVCAIPYVFEIIVEPANLPGFDIPTSFCQENDTLFLPTTSIEGITGSWSEPFIDLNQTTSNHTIFFQLDNPLIDCFDDYEFTFSVTTSITTSFNLQDSLCRAMTLITLDSHSIEGYTGIWEPQTINFDTVISDQFVAQWTPLSDQASCLDDTIVQFMIIDDQIPLFTLPTSLCINSGIYILPDTSNNNIPGSWNIPQIDTESGGPQILDLVFTPEENFCASTINLSIEITEDIIPEFELDSMVCINAAPFELPLISDNGIAGNWSIPQINPSDINGSLVSEFTPDGNANDCVAPVSYTFYTDTLVQPEFFLPPSFCTNFGNFPFSNTSANGITGQWAIPVFDPDIHTGSSFSNTFMPDDMACNTSLTVEIPIIHFDDIAISSTDPTSCGISNGSINISTTSNDFEFSIDNGANWTTSLTIGQLQSGSYTLLIRSRNDIYCTMQYPLQLVNPSAPEITEIMVSDVSNCIMADGSIVCIAQGQNLEYSIDGGISWQMNNLFENLADGQYNILVRSSDSPDCITDRLVVIEAVVPVTLVDISVSNNTDCNLNDGEITIQAEGDNLQYSIDGGASWQDHPQFVDLPEGLYNIIVENTTGTNCFQDTIISIFSPQQVTLIDVIAQHPDDCNAANGNIEFIASGTALEYSIDNGMTWSDNPVFTNLDQGSYLCHVREVGTINCTVDTSVELTYPLTPRLVDLVINDISDCVSTDASIVVSTDMLPSEISVDGGVSWQDNGMIDMLAPGNYLLIIRNPEATNCTSEYPFIIEDKVCPCNDLDITFVARPVNCNDPLSGHIEITEVLGNEYVDNYTIQWEDGSDQMSLGNLGSDWYSFQIFYDKNCIWNDSIFVEALDPLTFGLLSFDADCTDLGSIEVVDLEGGSGSFTYSLDAINYQNEGVFFNLSAQEYQVFIEDLLGCEGSDLASIDDVQNLDLSLPGIQTIQAGTTVSLNPLINVSTIDSFIWSPAVYINNPNELIAEVTPLESIEYTLQIFFGNCSEVRSVFIEVIDNRDIYLGDIFTPNGDGNNDRFFIQSSSDQDITVHNFLIYDRWGNLVFQNFGPDPNDASQGWNGLSNGQYVLPGVYVYMIEYNINGESKLKSGTVTLLR